MKWTEPTWDEMDIIYQSDEPVPEGKEQISEQDFDAIREGLDGDDR